MQERKVTVNELCEIIEGRKNYLREIAAEMKRELLNAPKGVLHISTGKRQTQYYYKKNSSDLTRKYIRKKDHDVARNLCQRDYDREVLLLAEKELQYLENTIKNYPYKICDEIYRMLASERKKLVLPIEQPLDEFIREWEERAYERKGFREDVPEFYTYKGERVRSKSEILIANTLEKYEVPYRYEYPLYLNGYGKIHPDFMVLNTRNRKEYYWEHMGRMDDPEYAEEALRRIEAYEKNGFFPGEQLILTHETMMNPLNSKRIEKLIVRYLK